MLGSCTWLLSLAAPSRISETSKRHSYICFQKHCPIDLDSKQICWVFFHEQTAVPVKTVHNEVCGLSQYTLKLCLEVKAAVDV